MLTTSSASGAPGVPPLALPPELKARYLALQQEADFALWRAREASQEVRRRYEAHVRGEGALPAAELLAELTRLEHDAETKYREFRGFLREHFA